MEIIARHAWNARPPKSVQHQSESVRRYFVVHHSGAPAGQSVRAIQDWCMDGRGFSDIDYNFLVRSTTGEIYEGRGWGVTGAHTIDYNLTGLGVCVIGDNPVLNDATKTALRWLRDEASRYAGHTLHVRGHGELTGKTACPGAHIGAWLIAGMPAPAPPTTTPPPVGDDMTVEDVKTGYATATSTDRTWMLDRIAKRGWSNISDRELMEYIAEQTFAPAGGAENGLQERLTRIEEALGKVEAALEKPEAP